MPTKENSSGKQQPYDAETGKFSSFSGSKKEEKRDYDKEIATLKEQTKGLSMFSPERKKIVEKINQLEAEKEGFKSYDELKEFRHNKLLEKNKNKVEYQEQSQKEDYMMSHRPAETGITADNLINQDVKTPMPDNYYEILNNQAKYDIDIKETMDQLNKIKNNPDAEITIYRATTGNSINDGDWITLSKNYANKHNEHSLGNKGNVVEMKVKAKDIQFAGDDIKEWGYYPQDDDEFVLSPKNLEVLKATEEGKDLIMKAPEMTKEELKKAVYEFLKK